MQVVVASVTVYVALVVVLTALLGAVVVVQAVVQRVQQTAARPRVPLTALLHRAARRSAVAATPSEGLVAPRRA